MPTAKAQYSGDGEWTKPHVFSDGLKKNLRDVYFDGAERRQRSAAMESSTASLPVQDPADQFVDEVLVEASWALSELHALGLGLTKQELRAEQRDLLKTLKHARDKLRCLSSDFDRLLGPAANPLGCADHLDDLLPSVEAAATAIDAVPPKRKLSEAQHDILVEMTIRVLRVLENHSLPISATASLDYPNSKSFAVRLLKAIGDDMRIALSTLTWRDIIIAVKTKL